GRALKENRQIFELQDLQRKKTFYAFLPVADGLAPEIPAGSRLQVAGVFKAQTDTVADFGQVITSFEMFLNSPRDLWVLQRPSWWTPKRLLAALTGLAVIFLFCVAWV